MHIICSAACFFIYFEKENIWTFDSKGELLITIMSSLAQEESRSISENVTWGQRKRFADGKVSLGYSRFLGYAKGENGTLKVVPEEAETVRRIYRMFLEGKTTQGIANSLTELGVKTPGGKDVWLASTIGSILQNEKYKGDARLQKSFTTDFLTKTMKKNEGEVPQYYVEDCHEAIIDPDEFEAVQDELARRKKLGRAYSDKAFHSKLICGDCGGFYGRKVWHSTDEYRSVIYQCNRKFSRTNKCRTPTLTENEIKDKFIRAYNALMENRADVLADCELIRQALCDTSGIDAGLAEAQTEMKVTAQIIEAHISKNAAVAQNQDEYNRETERIESRYNAAVNRYASLEAELTKRQMKSRKIRAYIKQLARRPLILENWDERLWITVLDTATVHEDGRVVFRFKNGTEITVLK